jgi:uncharacterized protein (TIGR00251 family)
MRISIRVKSGSKANSVEILPDGSYAVRVKAPAKEGKANKAVVEALSEYFGRPKSAFTIVMGQTSKSKVIDIA